MVDELQAALAGHSPYDETEAGMLARAALFVANTPECLSRATVAGHITASAWIVNPARDRTLLVHHGKLRRWLQPGGHIEPGDASLLDAALREACEETGMQVVPLSTALFDVDVHHIPGRVGTPGHSHYDMRYLLVADDSVPPSTSTESSDVHWFPIAGLQDDDVDESVRRMALKCRAQAPPRLASPPPRCTTPDRASG